jgi:hypothetical protein
VRKLKSVNWDRGTARHARESSVGRQSHQRGRIIVSYADCCVTNLCGAPLSATTPVWEMSGAFDWGESAPMPGLDDAQVDVDIVAYRVGVGANLVCLGDESLGVRSVETGKRNGQCNGQTKSALRSWANSNGCRDRSIVRHLWSTLRGHELHRAKEAGRISSCEQLLRIVSLAANATQLPWPVQFDVERSVECGGPAIAAANGAG